VTQLHPAAFKSGPPLWDAGAAMRRSAAAPRDADDNLTDVDLLQLRDIAATATHRVTNVATSLGLAVLKRERAERSVWRSRIVDLLARLVSLPMLAPVPSHGGHRGQAVEVQRLRTLHAAGLPVPDVLHAEPGFFVMQRLDGPNLVQVIERGGPQARLAWRHGLETLVAVHARGHALSHAFARNFIVTGDGLAMIDFEDDPLETLSLAQAQARDWMLYLHSTVWQLEQAAMPQVRADLDATLAQESGAVRALVRRAGQRLSLLRHLPSRRRPWGREVVGARALAQLLHALPPPPAISP